MEIPSPHATQLTHPSNLYPRTQMSLPPDPSPMQSIQHLPNIRRERNQHLRSLAAHAHQPDGGFRVGACFRIEDHGDGFGLCAEAGRSNRCIRGRLEGVLLGAWNGGGFGEWQRGRGNGTSNRHSCCFRCCPPYASRVVSKMKEAGRGGKGTEYTIIVASSTMIGVVRGTRGDDKGVEVLKSVQQKVRISSGWRRNGQRAKMGQP